MYVGKIQSLANFSLVVVPQLNNQKGKKAEATATLNATYQAKKTAYDESAASLQQSESLLQTLITGLSASADKQDSSGYMGQLAAARAQLSTIGSSAEEAKVKIAHMQKELKDKEPKAKRAIADGGGLVKELAEAKAVFAKLEKEIASFDTDAAAAGELMSKRDECHRAVRSLQEQRDKVKSGLGRLNFEYTNPTRDFDRSTVKGLVANLITIDPKQYTSSMALEVCAGGRLYNVRAFDFSSRVSLIQSSGRRRQRERR